MIGRVGPKIREARIKLGLTQLQLADRAGIAERYLCGMECEKTSARAGPRFVTVQAIAGALGMTTSELAGEVSTRPSDAVVGELLLHLSEMYSMLARQGVVFGDTTRGEK